ncbi:hypothetical protein O3M35_002056 [Rhynocoris fuscipes]|uniref:Cilia- and flagella-associated protein 52 n=1 Tax=Rhynocoris fuscipes TaxID=488301 RepID=A0AAW1CS85_9HEMI
MPEDADIKDLELLSIIGFDGNAVKGLRVHPDGENILYPFGTKVAIQNIYSREHKYLEGHTNLISSVAISTSGKYVGSGQINHMGFQAAVMVWDYETLQCIFKHDSHKVRVENVQISVCENFIISLGGRDDANVVVFDFTTGDAICGTFSSNLNAGDAVTIGAMNTRNLCFVTGGVYTLKFWTLDPKNKSVLGEDVLMGKIRRKITCIEVEKFDEFVWCGTSTGDIMKVKTNLDKDNLQNSYPKSTPFLIGCFAKYPSNNKKKKTIEPELWVVGVRSIVLWKEGHMIVGSGDGTVDLVKQQPFVISKLEKSASHQLATPTAPLFVVLKSCHVGGFVTSMQILPSKTQLIVGTMSCEMHVVELDTFNTTLYATCHTQPIYSLAFPRDYSDVFATASKNDVRVWSVSRSKELLRISVPNFTCTTVIFSPNGKSILTGWNDGNIRAFTPQSGRLMFTMINAHNKGVTAIAMTSDCNKLVSGGVEGQVRIWEMRCQNRILLAVLKEHKGPVSSIDISPDDREAVSASSDGTCIIWDIVKCARLAILFSSSLFMCAKYHPNGYQLVTTGTNRQLGYWETFDGSLVREIEGSKSSALNSLDISQNGEYMVTGGNDQYVKLWRYKEGYVTHVGLGHGAAISSVKLSSDMKVLVSCSVDGAIFIWKTPIEKEEEKVVTTPPRISSPKREEKLEEISPEQTVQSENNAEEDRHNGTSKSSSKSSVQSRKSSAASSPKDAQSRKSSASKSPSECASKCTCPDE